MSGASVDVAAERGGRFEAMSPFEVAAGWVFGLIPPDARPVVHPVLPPREVLDDTLIAALQSGQCFVLFSGGRDSSALLACATLAARREGLPLPVPVTRLFPGDAAASEEHWQQFVVGRLGLRDWLRIQVCDELDVLSPLATAGLVRHGVIYPPTAFPQAFTLRQLRGGRVLTGEGGDEVFGAQRITPVVALVRRRRAVTVALLAASGEALAPAAVRRRAAARHSPVTRDWLRPAARAKAEKLAARDAAAQPLWWGNALRHLVRHRGLRTGLRNLAGVATESGVDLVHPFLDHRFVEAMATWGGRFGPVGRSETMLRLFGDVLPAPVLSRKSKAVFNATAVNSHSRQFLRSWDGCGLDQDVVDVDVLRSRWAEAAPAPATLALLQQAWLSAHSTRPPRAPSALPPSYP